MGPQQLPMRMPDENAVCRIIRGGTLPALAHLLVVARTNARDKFFSMMIGGLTLFLFTPAFAQELSDGAVPMNDCRLHSGKTACLKYPEYFNDLDKAREQVYRGRYKTALMSLQKIQKGEARRLRLSKRRQ